MATFQPLLTPPTTFSFGQRASEKKTSLNSALPSMRATRPPTCWMVAKASSISKAVGSRKPLNCPNRMSSSV